MICTRRTRDWHGNAFTLSLIGYTSTSEIAVRNRLFAATSSRDVFFIKLWATTLRMPEMEKAYRKYHNGQV